MIRVMIVEDDPATRSRLAAMIALERDMCISGLADNVADGLQLLRTARHDVLLTDLGLPDGTGLTLIRTANAEFPAMEVMVITVFGDESHVIAAIEAGATGYLLKDGTAEYVTSSIRDLLDGGSPISPAIARHVLRRFVPGNGAARPAVVAVGVDDDVAPASVPAPGAGARSSARAVAAPSRAGGERSLLTPKEVAVLQQIAKGFTYAEIADALGVTVHTVTTHIKHLYRKLAVRSRGEAVFEAVQLGLIRVERQDGA